ncbi:MAG TPA: hypothetical protein VNE21_05940, partial [Mycobacteriales bacterium]|nr:hypothetical protein [Mycobacteriales bacterium]
IDELGKAFANTGPDLRRLIQQGDALTQAAQLNLPQTIKLIDDGKTVLDTQRATSGDLQTFAANLASFSQQLVTSDPALRGVLDNGVVSAQQLQGLLQDNQTELPVLLDNLVTLSGIQEARIPGLKTILVLYPPNVANGFFTAASGYAHFGLVTTSAPTACTSGYGSTTQHPNTPAGWGKPANLNTYCTAPNQAPTGASDVRGAALAPRPPGDTTAGPPPGGYPQLAPGAVTPGTLAAEALSLGAVAPVTASTADGPRTLVPYDPLSGLLQAPNGRTYLLGDTGGEQSYLGSQSWEWLLLAPAYG